MNTETTTIERTTAIRVLSLAADPNAQHFCWAAIIIGAGGMRHQLASDKGVVSHAYKFEDGSSLYLPEFGTTSNPFPSEFSGTFHDGFAFKK